MTTLEILNLELFLRMRTKICWTTKEGKEIPIAQLSDKHLVNIINMIEAKEEEDAFWREVEENRPDFL